MLKKKLLHIDGFGGLFVGILVLTLNTWLSELYNLPQNLILFTGFANLLFGLFSSSLALRTNRPIKLIKLLVILNLTGQLYALYYQHFILKQLHFLVFFIFLVKVFM